MSRKEQLALLEAKTRDLLKVVEDAAVLPSKKRNALPDSSFAVPGKRKLPIHDEPHCKNAMSRFSQTMGLTDAEKRTAYRKILRAAKRFGIDTTGFQEKYGKKYG